MLILRAMSLITGICYDSDALRGHWRAAEEQRVCCRAFAVATPMIYAAVTAMPP